MAENTNTEREAADASAILSKICDLFQVGKQARTESTIMMNVKNVIRFARLLHAVERDLFPQPELPEDDGPYATVDDGLPAPNSWGAKDEADYVAQFRAALAARASLSLPAACGNTPYDEGPFTLAESLPAAGQEPVAEVFTMEALAPGGGVKYHATIHKPVPAGTKLYAAPPTAQAEGWRSMETAPRDGTEVLANTAGLGRVVVYWDDEESKWGTGLGYLDRDAPTHWMPLPPPPTSAEGVEHG